MEYLKQDLAKLDQQIQEISIIEDDREMNITPTLMINTIPPVVETIRDCNKSILKKNTITTILPKKTIQFATKPVIMIRKINCPDNEVFTYAEYIKASAEKLSLSIVECMNKLYNESPKFGDIQKGRKCFDIKFSFNRCSETPHNIFKMIAERTCQILFDKIETTPFEVYTVYNEHTSIADKKKNSIDEPTNIGNCYDLCRYINKPVFNSHHTSTLTPMTAHYAIIAKSLVPICPYSIYYYNPMEINKLDKYTYIPNVDRYVFVFRFRVRQIPNFKVVTETRSFL